MREEILAASPAAVKTYVALEKLDRESGRPFAAFAASILTLSSLTGLSHPTVVRARQELVAMRLVEEAGTSGYYRLPPVKKVATPKGSRSFSLNTQVIPLIKGRKKKTSPLAAGDKNLNGLSVEDRRLAVKAACKALGVPETGGYVQMAMKKLYRLLRDGVAVEDAILVARFCRQNYDAGDRFLRRINLLYIWSVGEFPVLLAAAREPAPPRGEYRVTAPGAARDEWDEAHAAKLRERGLSSVADMSPR
mgnify:FL=1